MTNVQVQVSDELFRELGQQQLQSLTQETLLVKLYEMGEISSGWAAETLGIARREFLEILDRYSISSFDEEVDLNVELHRGRQ